MPIMTSVLVYLTYLDAERQIALLADAQILLHVPRFLGDLQQPDQMGAGPLLLYD